METTRSGTAIRGLLPGDLAAVVRLDALLTGEPKAPYWRGVLERFLRREGCIGLAADAAEGLAGYLFAEVRAFEFGSEACGWIFAVGVHPDCARGGVASALLGEAHRRFRRLGVASVRTMVRRADVPLLSFFRRHGFVGGPFVQLELALALEGGADAEEQA
jgi:ribosomal protein S18 acetylase RimI-like enzyme